MQIIGNIGSQPVPRTSNGGKEFLTFRFAENHMGPNHTGNEIPPTWYEISAFVKPEEQLLLQKGAFLRLTGRLTPKVWFVNKEVTEANARVNLSVLVHKAETIPRKNREGAESSGDNGSDQAPAEQPAQAARPVASRTPAPATPAANRISEGFDDMDDDDIPF